MDGFVEPIETVRAILQWITDTPHATAAISYSHEYGWHITAFIDEGEEIDD